MSVYGIVGSTLWDRGLSLFFGVAIAMMIWARDELVTENMRGSLVKVEDYG
jgi:hypothetical protein